MIKLKQVIIQLSDNDFEKISNSLKKTKAENYCLLLQSYRSGKLPDAEITEKLGISSNSFYVLKSRLYDKIQEHLSVDVFSTQESLMKQLLQVPEVCFNMPRETAIAFLHKLEKELLKFDLHNDLLVVYSALKKMHLYSEKYFYYSQLFNKQTALGLSLEKAEEILGNFNRILGQHSFSKSQQHLDTLYFLKNEINNLYELNPSRQIEIIKYFVELQLAIFCEESKGGSVPIAEVIQQARKVFAELPDTSVQKKWEFVLDYLSFEYYLGIEEYKASTPLYEKVNENLSTLLLYNNICATHKFLVSKIKFCNETSRTDDLMVDPKKTEIYYDKDDSHAGVQIALYNSMLYYKQRNFKEAINMLNAILNNFSFKDLFHESINIKLTLAYFYLVQKDFDMVEITLKSVSRKIKSEQHERYYHVLHLIKIFESEMNNAGSTKSINKNKDFFVLFNANNKKSNEVLGHLICDLKKKYN
jgi:tetratricopeptide (TPR) repeat protein